MSLWKRSPLLLAALAITLGAAGCELVADFDRTRIEAGGNDATDESIVDEGGTDAADESQTADASDASDATTDADDGSTVADAADSG